jgi:carboxymethylenebutenolidase
MTEQKIQIPTAGGTTEGVIYFPEKAGRWPGVIHYTDIGGIRASHEQMARRLAGAGYVVLMPNVFYRTRGLPLFDFPLKLGEERTTKRLAELSTPLTAEAITCDASDYVDFLLRQASVKPGPMGVVGYCFTGKMALYTAFSRPDRIAAAASFHGGGLATDAPNSPHLILSPLMWRGRPRELSSRSKAAGEVGRPALRKSAFCDFLQLLQMVEVLARHHSHDVVHGFLAAFECWP